MLSKFVPTFIHRACARGIGQQTCDPRAALGGRDPVPRRRKSDLAPMEGILVGVVLSLGLWGLIGAVIWLVSGRF